MLDTFAVLLLAHMVADFVLQPKTLIDHKSRPPVFGVHLLIVAATAWAALGVNPLQGSTGLWLILALTGVHGVIDAIKQIVVRKADEAALVAFHAFWVDQAAHLIALFGLAAVFPAAFAQGEWAWRFGEAASAYVQLAWVTAGFLAVTLGAGFGIRLYMKTFAAPPAAPAMPAEGAAQTSTPPASSSEPDDGLERGGFVIGVLERALIFGLTLSGALTAVGFVVAGKSLLRFQSFQERTASEYVLIGTLASTAAALAIAGATRWGLGQL